ncbi:hypothetical protein Bbelb_358210 [Branchiostoma belcheri]|nr:hypothetical protein Bbelb_358210 [Branchiostoma belcheri]
MSQFTRSVTPHANRARLGFGKRRQTDSAPCVSGRSRAAEGRPPLPGSNYFTLRDRENARQRQHEAGSESLAKRQRAQEIGGELARMSARLHPQTCGAPMCTGWPAFPWAAPKFSTTLQSFLCLASFETALVGIDWLRRHCWQHPITNNLAHDHGLEKVEKTPEGRWWMGRQTAVWRNKSGETGYRYGLAHFECTRGESIAATQRLAGSETRAPGRTRDRWEEIETVPAYLRH